MKSKRIFALLLAMTLLLGVYMPVFATETEEQTEETQPIETQPEQVFETVYIEDADDLLELAENCALDTWSIGKRVILQADISLNDVEFLPIPTFGGIFDGNGHIISDLHITENVMPAGLFGELQTTGIITDLTVSGSIVPGGDAQFVGGVVGENYGAVTNCIFTGSIMGKSNVGAITGINGLTGKIAGCEAGGTVIGSDMTGGIAGCNLGIIGSSTNKAYINTVSIDPAINPEDLSFDFLTDMSKLTSLNTGAAAIDTGGIAGYSSGIIESCANKASIGYPRIGYNVGGIVGRSCGYVHCCENTGGICGRKDVGGIAGQMEPYIAKNLTESALAKLERQLGELDALLDAAQEHEGKASNAITNRLNGIAGSMGAAGNAAQDIRTTGTITGSVTGSGETSGEGGVTVTPAEGNTGGSVNVGDGSVSVEIGGSISGGVEAEGSASGSGGVDAQTQINISTNLGGLASALYGMSGQMSMLSGELDGASGELIADVELIRAKINEITETGFELILGDGEEDAIIDSSEINIDLITLGKLSCCTNNSAVNGDINVGGIAGCMGMEYSLDPEDDVTVSIDGSTRRKYEVKAVIQHCANNGAVTAKRNYAGGIAGKMDLGLIAQCEAYGAVSSESGNYVGGIAGIGGSTVRHCFSKCALSGGKYVGGIVGAGVESDKNGDSSTVAACYAIVDITDYKQYAGAVSGFYAGTFLENYFVSEDLAGINRRSFTGCAEPLSYDELLAMFEKAEEPVPEEFKKFHLKFVVDGEVIWSDIFDYGASFGPEVFPEIPEKTGYYGYWDRATLENLKFDTTVTAVYEPYLSALAGQDTRNGEKEVFFVEGDFGSGDSLKAISMPLSAAEFDIPESVWDGIVKSLTHLKVNTEVVEQWQLQLPEDGRNTNTIRYLPPNGNADSMDVYVKSDGEWIKTETKVIGSYVTFPVGDADVQIAVVRAMNTAWLLFIFVALLAALLVWMLRIILKARALIPIRVLFQATAQNADAKAASPVNRFFAGVPAKWRTVILVILALLLGIGGTAAFFLLPDLMADVGAYEILKEYAEREEISMELQAEAELNDITYPITAELDRVTENGQKIHVITENGRSLYYSDGVVFMENGSAYKLGAAFPDYSRLLEKTMALYRHVEIEAVNGSYAVTAQQDDANAILELLIPAAAEYTSDTDSLTVKLIMDGDDLDRIEFSGKGKLSDGKQTVYTIDATLNILDTNRTVDIPAQVTEALASGDYESMEALSQDLYRLANGWQALNNHNPLSAELKLTADCGPVVLNETLELHRWNTENQQIFCVQENGYALYFNEDTICDSKGNAISAGSASHTDAAQLLDIAYDICLNASASCIRTGQRYTYTLELNEAGMESVAYAIAPEAEKLNIRFESGSVRVVVAGETVESVEITVSGSVKIALSTADVSIGAKLTFREDKGDIDIPEAVASALAHRR